MKEDLNGAITDFFYLLRARSCHKSAAENKAIADYKMGNFEAAVMDYTDVIKFSPKNATLFCTKRHLFTRNKAI